MFNQPFRNFGAVLAILALLSPIFAQQNTRKQAARTKPKSSSTTAKKASDSKPKAEATPDPADENARFEAAIAETNATKKAELLVKFIADYPKSENKSRAEESLAGARAAIADERLTSGDVQAAVRLFKLAVNDAPKPYSDRLFTGVIATIPANLYWRGYKAEGIDLAKLIETHIASDANKLLLLSTFYLGTENGGEAKRIAESAIKLDEKNAAAHQSLATAHRLNFDLEAAAASFAKSVELDPESTTSKRSLADMKRALGKADEAEAIYREILATNEKDNQARTGLVLSLFDLGKRTEAEAEMAKALDEVPGNVVLLGGAAYWYAANKDGDKAVELARSAIEKEPRYVWSHIALGRGLMLQGKPVEAEQVLLAARKYGNFPTLQYEIASARFAAGFFREAAEELKKSFVVSDGIVSTRLGGRVPKSADTFTEAVALERRASIFSPAAADSAEDAARLKSLFEFSNRIAAKAKDEPAIVAAAEGFANGTDNMSVHRKLYAAEMLLQNDVAADEAAKLAGSAVAGLDRSLEVADPEAAVMASELYEARNASFSRDGFLLIPDVPRQTLDDLMRGRVEEITGLALLGQGKPEEATVRFRRALTVLPKDSAWWRSSTWNLGRSLAAEGKAKEALDALIASYATGKPDLAKYILIEQLWTKTNGNRDGLEEKIGPNPLPDFSAVAKLEPTPEPSPTIQSVSQTETPLTSIDAAPSTETTPDPSPETVTPSPSPSPAKVSEIPSPSPETNPTPEATPSPLVSAEPSPEAALPAASPEVTPSPETTPTPSPSGEPSPEETSTPSELPEETTTPKAIPTPNPSPEISPTSASPSETLVATIREPSEPVAAKPSPVEGAPPRKNTGSLFEPIIIRIPKAGSAETGSKKSGDPTTTDSSEKLDANAEAGLARPRIVDGKAITGELMPCEIGVSQESVSLINNGGSISMLVSIEEGEDIGLVTGVSNSPADVEVRLEPELVSISGRSMYVIKSISAKTGMYQVAFKAPCGKKEVIVRVR